MKNKLMTVLLLINSFNIISQQNYINELWIKNHSLTGNQDKIATAIDPNGNFVIIGNILNASNNSDIVLSCVHPNGNLAWQQTCPSSATQDDYGIDLKIDNTGNIYLTGVHHNGNNKDYFVAKYSQMGNLIWQNYYNGNANGDDIPAALEIDQNGNVYVTGTTYGGWTMTDWATIKYDNNGNQQWIKKYNFNNKAEIAQDIIIDNNGDIVVLGTSANNWNNSDFVVRKYNTNGTVLATKRHNSAGLGYDLPQKIITDNNNNYYVTGMADNNGNKNIKTIAYNTNLQVLWTNYIDLYNQTDEAFDIDTDNNGYVFITGYSQKPNGGLNAVVSKINSINGNEIWTKEYSTLIENDIAKAKTVLCDNNSIYIGGETTTNGARNYLLLGLNQNGDTQIYKEFNISNNDQIQQITKQNNNIYLSGISDSSNVRKATTVKVSTLRKNNNVILDSNGKPIAFDDELLMRFNPNELIMSNVDDKKKTWGIVADFLKPDAIAYFNEKTKLDFGKLQCYKVFPNTTSADSIATGHLGQIIKLPPLHATFGVLLPTGTNDTLIFDNLLTATPHILLVTYNHICELSFTPNDPEFNNGNSAALTPTSTIPDAHINIQPAWDYETGDSSIIVGVYDSGINKVHEELSDGTISTSTVKEGYNYLNNTPSYNLPTTDDYGHGTLVTGIIAAKTNNGTGISGVAGGNNQDQTPVTIHDMKLFKKKNDPCEGPPVIFSNHFASASNIAQALLDGGTGSGNITTQQLIMNHSWVGPYNYLIKERFIDNYKIGITNICASGNFDEDTSYNSCEYHSFPNSYLDNMILKVGGNDSTGTKAGFSECGAYLDIIAPATQDLYIALDNTTNSYTDSLDTHPTCPRIPIYGTSFATPHATGVAALMQSYYLHNLPTNQYDNILSPEDIEQMMERNATDITTNGASVGYDDPTGYGRLNAGAIFDSLKYPEFLIYHQSFNVNLSNAVLAGTNESTCIEFTNNPNLPLGATKVNRWLVTASNTHTLPSGYNLIDAWSRGSGSDLYGLYSDTSLFPCNSNYNHPALENAPNVFITSVNSNSINMYAYIYEILDSNNNTIGWLPKSPSDIGVFAYTLYLSNPFAGIVEKDNTLAVLLYPNPSSNQVTLEFKENIPNQTTITLTDVTGKLIKTILPANLTSNNKKITFDVSNLAKGVYFAVISNTKGTVTKKLIVN